MERVPSRPVSLPDPFATIRLLEISAAAPACQTKVGSYSVRDIGCQHAPINGKFNLASYLTHQAMPSNNG